MSHKSNVQSSVPKSGVVMAALLASRAAVRRPFESRAALRPREQSNQSKETTTKRAHLVPIEARVGSKRDNNVPPDATD